MAIDEQRFAVAALVGAISSMVTNVVGSGELERLTALREPLSEFARALSNQPLNARS